jgi:hypothetical protein
MTKSLQNMEDRRLQRKTAAFRLKHDVGKALRWSAPEERETNPDELRARLVADLLPRTKGGRAGRDVLESFFEWKREEGPLFASGDPDLEALTDAMAIIERFTPRLLQFKESSSSPSPSSESRISFLPESSLLSLDEACLEASRACTAFYRRVALEEGPEIMRPTRARR